jgi:membrane protein YdbS with pleckstrin-like domain
MDDLVTSAWVILSGLFVATLVIANAENIYALSKGLAGKRAVKEHRKSVGYIEESLSPGEKIEVIFKLHWAAWAPVYILVALSLLTFGITLPIAAYAWLRLRNIEMGLTNKRVVMKKGIIGRKTEEMQVASIETVEMDQGAVGRIFGFAAVKITGRGTSSIVFKTLNNPLAAKKTIEKFCPAFSTAE